MLSFGRAANETFSFDLEEAEEHPRGQDQAAAGRLSSPEAECPPVMRRGDEVVFDRLDLAEALGIWRNARGRIVGVYGRGDRPATVDVQFEGHDTLERYLPELFRPTH